MTLWTLVGMAGGTGTLLAASALRSSPTFLVAFTVLFALTGIRNGSVYKLIPFHSRAEHTTDVTTSRHQAKELTGTGIGIANAAGELGGVFINLATRRT